MAEFVGPDGGYFIDGDDLDHIRTVMYWTDADGVRHAKEYIASYSTFVLWNRRANAIIAEVEKRRAKERILTLPRGKVRSAG